MSSAEAAARLLSLLNDERAAAGLAPFTMRADVTDIAARWTSSMAAANHLAHNDAYFTKDTRQRLDARLLGENVAYDGSVDAAHRALMASPPHRANILDGRFTVIGIGAQLEGRTWWVTQDFLQPSTTAPVAAASAPESAAPAAEPVAVTTTAPSRSPSPAPTPDTTVAPATTDAASGEVLSASSAEPVVAAPLEPTGSVVVSAAAPSSSSDSSRPMQLAVAGFALVAAYAISWASASARIRCRWSPRRTSRG